MNVLLVHNFYQQAGGEDAVFAEEAKLLSDRGHHVRSLTFHNDAVDDMGRLTLASKTLWNGSVHETIRRIARRDAIDVAHFHNTFPLVSPAAYYAARDAGAAVVQTLHNYRLLCPSATLFHDGHVWERCVGRPVPWPAVAERVYRGSLSATAVLAGMLTAHRAAGTYRRAVDGYIALTDFARRKFIEGRLPPSRIFVKPNFVDPDPGVGVEPRERFALFVGRLSPEKGLDVLLDAWSKLGDAMPLKIAGDGPMKERVVRASENLPNVAWLGRLGGDAVYDLMGRADVLIFPSLWYEGLPKTIVESFAIGTPVIASRLGSMQELIDHERTGLVFESGDADALASAVHRIEREPQLAQTMRRLARLEYETKYTADENYRRLIEIYQRVTSGKVKVQSGNGVVDA